MAESKIRLELDVLFAGLYDRDSRPPEIEHLAENQIVKAILVQLRSGKLGKKVRRQTEKRLLKVVRSKKLNDHGRRRALEHLLRRKRQGKLSRSVEKGVNQFLGKNRKKDWVKKALS